MAIEIILFDMDGTLVDTEKAASKIVHEVFRDWNLQVQPEDAQYVTGRRWDVVFDYLSARYPVPMVGDALHEHVLSRYREALKASLPQVPGAVQAVKNLSEEYPLALVSGSNRSEIFWILEQLGIRDRFKTILGAEDYLRSKPAPDGYLKAMQILGKQGKPGLVFEDSEAGITSAKLADLVVAAVTCCNHFNQDLSQAHHHISDFTGVDREWVKKLKT